MGLCEARVRRVSVSRVRDTGVPSTASLGCRRVLSSHFSTCGALSHALPDDFAATRVATLAGENCEDGRPREADDPRTTTRAPARRRSSSRVDELTAFTRGG